MSNNQYKLFIAKPPINNWWLLLLVMIVFVPHLYYSYHLMMGNQTHDLHLRIIGSRLMEAGKNPYTYYWQQGDNMLWYDPNQSVYSDVNGVTSTPFFLWLQQPLLRLNYCQIRLLWWIVEELFLLATISLAMLMPITRVRQILLLIAIGIFFLFSRNWWLHVLNGQMYMLYAFVFMLCSYMLLKKGRNISFWLYPVVCLVRPLFVFSLLPFLKWGKKVLKPLAVGTVTALLLFVASGTSKHWVQYSAALKVYAIEATGDYDSTLRNKEARLGNFAAEDCLKKEKKPDFLHAGCLYSIQSYLSKIGININNTNVFAVGLIVVIALVLFGNARMHWAKKDEQKMMLAILLYFMAELFAPASRNPYNMVQWLPAATLLMTFANNKLMAVFFIGICLNHSIPFDIKYVKELGEVLMFVAAWLFVLQPMGSTSRYKNSILPQS